MITHHRFQRLNLPFAAAETEVEAQRTINIANRKTIQSKRIVF
jgi:hypothetical protein